MPILYIQYVSINIRIHIFLEIVFVKLNSVPSILPHVFLTVVFSIFSSYCKSMNLKYVFDFYYKNISTEIIFYVFVISICYA